MSFTRVMKRLQSSVDSSTKHVASIFTRNWSVTQTSTTTRSIVDTKSAENAESKPAYKLHPYQRECVEFGLSRPACAWFLAPGLGKTLITLTVFKILKNLGLVDELVIVAKRRIVYGVWRQEVKKWRLPFHCVIVHGRKKLAALYEHADIRIINYEGLEWLSNQPKFFKRKKKLMLACDESSMIRNTNTVRFRSLKKILPFFVRRYILTGSPAPNSLMNLFGQVYALDLGEAFGGFITRFRNEYFYPSGFMGYQWTLQRGAKKRIYKRIKPLVIRFGTDQLNMPPLTFVDRFVKLPPSVREEYDTLERERVLEYRKGSIVAVNAAVATGKLRQIANGGAYYTVEGKLIDEVTGRKIPPRWRTMHDEKCANLVDLLEELQGEPALCSFEFQHDKFRLRQYFKKHAPQFADAPFVDGKSKERDVEKLLTKWDKGLLPVMFGHPASVAHGLNLQGKGGIVIFFAMTWSLENYEQFVQRVWRQGQKRRVMVYRILCQDTVDEDMVTAIELKDRNQTGFLKAMNRRFVRRERQRLAA